VFFLLAVVGGVQQTMDEAARSEQCRGHRGT
jgi:hypothetical protein